MTIASRFLPALVLAAGVGLSTQACAAQTYGYGYPGGRNGGYGRELERRAYENGYREGVEEGQNDARRGRDFSYQRHDEYRDADAGFRRSDGDINRYRRSYRDGFQAGYGESYNRNARNRGYDGRDNDRRGNGGYSYPNGGYGRDRGGYGSPAAQNGYRDGVDAGREDARDRNRFDPVRAKRYREGDHDYNNRYGSRDEYKREYRSAFEQGYREGYGASRR
jgi:hypothetical protein